MRLLFLIFKKIIIIVWIIIKDAHVYLRDIYIYIYTVSDKRGTGRRDYYVL